MPAGLFRSTAWSRTLDTSPAGRQGERQRIASIAVAAAFATAKILYADDEEEYDPPTAEDLEAIGRGLEDIREGRYRDGNEFFAELREKHGWPEKSKDNH